MIVHRAPFADQVTVLDAQGRVKDNGTSGEAISALGFAKNEEKRTSHQKNDGVREQEEGVTKLETMLATKRIEADSTRRLGDWSMYNFYAQATGWSTLTRFSIAMVVFAFCGAFPRKCPSAYAYPLPS